MNVFMRASLARPWGDESIRNVLYGCVFVIVATLVIAPIVFLIVSSFQLSTSGQPPMWGLRAWEKALANPNIWVAMWNSIRLYLSTSVISWPIAILLAWVIGRTDIPMKRTIEFLLWISFCRA